MSLTREQILQAQDVEIKKISVPEWDGDIFIRQLTRKEQDEYLKRQFEKPKISTRTGAQIDQQVDMSMNIYGHDAYLCACSICNDKGERLFSVKDIQALDDKNGIVIGKIAQEIIKFSELGADLDTLSELKNSQTVPT